MMIVALHKPDPGKTLVVALKPHHTFVFEQAPEDILWNREGDSLYVTFHDGAIILLSHFFSPGTTEDIFFQFGEEIFLAQDLVSAMAADLQTDSPDAPGATAYHAGAGEAGAAFPATEEEHFAPASCPVGGMTVAEHCDSPAAGMGASLSSGEIVLEEKTGAGLSFQDEEDAFLFESVSGPDVDGSHFSSLAEELREPVSFFSPLHEQECPLKLEDVLVEFPQPPLQQPETPETATPPNPPSEQSHHASITSLEQSYCHASITALAADSLDPSPLLPLLPDIL